MEIKINFSEKLKFLKDLIQEYGSDKELEWINRQEAKIYGDLTGPSFYLVFSSASRFIRKTNLQLTQEQLRESNRIREGFQPQYWNLLECVRTYFLLLLLNEDEVNFQEHLDRLFETADMDEQVTIFKALPLLPFPEALVKRTKEGIRTNITDVFDAIALNNPYPNEFLGTLAWNQMLIKAVFMQRPLYRIHKSDEMANSELAQMLIDFAHERWAANRQVTPELWRFVGPFMNRAHMRDIEKVIEGDSIERKAGLLACSASNLPWAQELLARHPDVKEEISSGRLNWTTIGEKTAVANG